MNPEIVEAQQNVAIQIPEQNQNKIPEQIPEQNVADSVRLKLESIPLSTTAQCSIYRVRERFRKISEFAHSPEMISIGPFHRATPSLAAMEDHKLRYAKALLSRTTPAGRNKLEECVACLENIEAEARKCYSEPISLNKKDFIEMMLIDGLFMIELFTKKASERILIERGDPIFSKIWGSSSIARDLILLENQLPMVVLESLFNVLELNKGEPGDVSLNILALRFLDPLMPRGTSLIESSLSSHQGKHILDLLSKTFLPPKVGNDEEKSWKSIPNVTELKRAGVKFVKSSTNGSFLNIKFKDGVLEIPPVIIQDQTDTLLRNFIASEQCCDGDVTCMASYAFLMDSLIDTAQDVAVLRKQGIIINYLGGDEDVASLFNKLCSEVSVANFYYSKLCDDVNTYYNTRWHGWGAAFRRDYLSSPWKFVSLVGAIILLILTFLATMFAILSYNYQIKHGNQASPPSHKS
ncbi:hypothetical protein MKW94_019681 [Papaver nudicaule]|uniref:Uncharacterized protein n=1 Tax=Papaver nudicaule TaxID=74823 RepID=A0AA42AWZ5_PAPNU|nr:hypothetical protein [Papaver nudicaule]